MLLTISTTHQPAAYLGHLLRKHPAGTHSFELSFGRAHVFYPEASEVRCTAALLMEVDPVGLVRNRRGRGTRAAQEEEAVEAKISLSEQRLGTGLPTPKRFLAPPGDWQSRERDERFDQV